jgi:hypothetical protein
MININEKKRGSANYMKKTLALGAASALAIVFLAATFFYPPSYADAASQVGYEDAFSFGRLDDTDVTSGDKLPDMMSFAVSD